MATKNDTIKLSFDFLRDPIAIMVITAAVAVGIAIWQHKTKGLSHWITSTPLASVGPVIKDRVQITYDGQPVANVRLIHITIQNKGKLPIDARDFFGPIEVRFDPAVRVLSAEIGRTEPENLRPELGLVPHTGKEQAGVLYGIQPLLLNVRDSMRLRFLVTGPNIKPAVSARISGVSRMSIGTDRLGYTIPIAYIVLVTAAALWLPYREMGFTTTYRDFVLRAILFAAPGAMLGLLLGWRERDKDRASREED